MKFPFKKPRGETILLKEGKWYLTLCKSIDGSFVEAATLHACEKAIEYDRGLRKGNYVDDMEDGNCVFCSEITPDSLIVTKNLIGRG